jgi:hypothetical protein
LKKGHLKVFEGNIFWCWFTFEIHFSQHFWPWWVSEWLCIKKLGVWANIWVKFMACCVANVYFLLVALEFELTHGFKLVKQALCCLSHTSKSRLFWRWGLANYLPRLTSNRNPPDLSL